MEQPDLGIRFESGPKGLIVANCAPGGPAAASGLVHPNDVLVAVNSRRVQRKDQAKAALSGTTGTEVEMLLQRGPGVVKVRLVRGAAQVNQAPPTMLQRRNTPPTMLQRQGTPPSLHPQQQMLGMQGIMSPHAAFNGMGPMMSPSHGNTESPRLSLQAGSPSPTIIPGSTMAWPSPRHQPSPRMLIRQGTPPMGLGPALVGQHGSTPPSNAAAVAAGHQPSPRMLARQNTPPMSPGMMSPSSDSHLPQSAAMLRRQNTPPNAGMNSASGPHRVAMEQHRMLSAGARRGAPPALARPVRQNSNNSLLSSLSGSQHSLLSHSEWAQSPANIMSPGGSLTASRGNLLQDQAMSSPRVAKKVVPKFGVAKDGVSPRVAPVNHAALKRRQKLIEAKQKQQRSPSVTSVPSPSSQPKSPGLSDEGSAVLPPPSPANARNTARLLHCFDNNPINFLPDECNTPTQPGKEPRNVLLDVDVAASRIGRWYRRMRLRQAVRQHRTFQVWNDLEGIDEQDAVRHAREFGRIERAVQKRNRDEMSLKLSSDKHWLQLWQKRYKKMPDPEGDGTSQRLYMSVPKTDADVKVIMDQIRDDIDNTVSKKLLWGLMLPLISHLEGQPTVVKVSVPLGGRLIVIGDTHGQIDDVFHIFEKHGKPSPTNVYLFNGDIADRGAHACEIFVLLAAFSAIHPSSVYFNRGNHETEPMNSREAGHGGGFMNECLKKFDIETYHLFQCLFQVMPLATVIGDHTLVLHGGLMHDRPAVSLDDVDRLDRTTVTESDSTSWRIIEDILWSDPVESPGCVPNTLRGAGNNFGPDVTHHFLKRHGLTRIIRSHECPRNLQGYEWHHDDKCLTVFSASNYCGKIGNRGAIAMFTTQSNAVNILTHLAPSRSASSHDRRSSVGGTFKVIMAAAKFMRKTKAKRLSTASRSMELMTNDIAQRIMLMLCEKRTELQAAFAAVDPYVAGEGRSHVVSMQTFTSVLCRVLNWELPFRHFASSFCPQESMVRAVEDSTTSTSTLTGINYEVLLDHYCLGRMAGSTWAHRMMAQVWRVLLRSDLSLKATLAEIDPDGDGRVSLWELERLLQAQRGMSDTQIKMLCSALFPSGAESETMSIDDFCSLFKFGFNPAILSPSSKSAVHLSDSDRRMLDAISAAMKLDVLDKQGAIGVSCASPGMGLTAVFQAFDTNGDGFVSPQEFAQAVIALPLALSDDEKAAWTIDELMALARKIDADGNGRLNYVEFVAAFGDGDARALRAVEGVAHAVHASLMAHRQLFLKALQSIDTDLSGVVSQDKFITSIQVANDVIPSMQMSDEQILLLAEYAPRDEAGNIHYLEFIDSVQLPELESSPSPSPTPSPER